MKILLVEDSDAIRVRLRTLIGELCCEASVYEASGEREATDEACREQPDLIILDLNLAEGSGLGVLDSVRLRVPQSRVAVLTNHAEIPYRKKCLSAGAEWFFDKADGFDGIGKVLASLYSQAGAQGQGMREGGSCR
jgi:DNA-binding NarL/FixJ family response regulator